jgi:hypothetical protein
MARAVSQQHWKYAPVSVARVCDGGKLFQTILNFAIVTWQMAFFSNFSPPKGSQAGTCLARNKQPLLIDEM